MASTFTSNKNLEQPGAGDYVDTWYIPLNADLAVIDKALGGVTTYSLASSNVTVTTSESQALRLKLTGTLSANVTISLPAVGGMWFVDNSTTGSFTVTIKTVTGGSTGVAVTQSARTIIVSDGTDVKYANDSSSSFASPTISGTITLSGTPTFSGAATVASAWTFSSTVAFSSTVTMSGTLAVTGKAYSEVDSVSYSASIALDLSQGQNWAIGTLTGNLTLANPTNFSAGQSGAIHLTQDATGSRTIAFGSFWKFQSGTAPVLSTAANTLDVLFYYCVSSSVILCALYNNVSS